MYTLRSDEKHNNQGVFYALTGELIPQLSYNSPPLLVTLLMSDTVC